MGLESWVAGADWCVSQITHLNLFNAIIHLERHLILITFLTRVGVLTPFTALLVWDHLRQRTMEHRARERIRISHHGLVP